MGFRSQTLKRQGQALPTEEEEDFTQIKVHYMSMTLWHRQS